MSEPLDQLVPPILYIFIIFALWGKDDLEPWRRWLGTITFCGFVIFGVFLLGGDTLISTIVMGSLTVLGVVLGLLWRQVVMNLYRRFVHQIPSGDD